ncbi:methyl-accepting chemotaxis protein [Inmirania thermothiophila]|uniref:Twitching motility protein PilJ n=1 Tax=Inmirania thermothiophila TaxID=1750597 RepID=A0A3N1Y5U6_9GAMM|nr:methyl-accepting chemotaxis protein [Inmirania thermothiophila]ROR34173.1 twitching motility protein PilJ [Inmirania thermothiophila]
MKLINLSGGRAGVGRYVVLVGLLVASVGAMAWLFRQQAVLEQTVKDYLVHTTDMRLTAIELGRLAAAATDGDIEAFDRLAAARARMVEHISHLALGHGEEAAGDGHAHGDGEAAGHGHGESGEAMVLPEVSPVPPDARDELQQLVERWNALHAQVQVVLPGREAVAAVAGLVPELERALPPLKDRARKLMDELAARRGGGAHMRELALVLAGLERIERAAGRLLRGDAAAVVAADTLARGAQEVQGALKALLEGDRARGIAPLPAPEVAALANAFTGISARIDEALAAVPDYFRVREAARDVEAALGRLDEATGALTAAIVDVEGTRWWSRPEAVYGVGALAPLLLILLGVQVVGQVRAQREESERLAREAEERNRRTQDAILTLLDEMASLADGDLTTNATVTEEITGAIADSVNYAIEALRELVLTIRRTAERVARAAQETRAVATHLAEAGEQQAARIEEAAGEIETMAASIDQVSRDAQSSAEVARRSVDIAHRGAETVRRTIEGMDATREQIQETAKRIKRLGESSQEIGSIVGLINDIADQTNILALNAAIQAAMAGEAGRGFAVVADEVQRLAERSAEATKQIETLVKAIQADTNEAVASMEETTAGVVQGARLAEEAGAALGEIEDVSRQLAGLVERISHSSVEQARAASSVANTMNVIRDITREVAAGSQETAQAVANLTELASELRASVAGFRLPQDAEMAVQSEAAPAAPAVEEAPAAPQPTAAAEPAVQGAPAVERRRPPAAAPELEDEARRAVEEEVAELAPEAVEEIDLDLGGETPVRAGGR